MTKQVIDTGAEANDNKGDSLRSAFTKINANFTELYSAIGADVQIPIQTGNAGKVLTTNGSTLSWGNTNKLVNDSYNFTLGVDGTINFDPAANGKGVLQTTADLWFNANGAIYNFGANGSMTFPDATVQTTAYQKVAVPAHSYGAAGDAAGMVAFDGNYIYYCKTAYVNNSTNIWVRVAWSGTTW